MDDGPRKRRKGEGSLFWHKRRERWNGVYVSAAGKRRAKSDRDWRVVEEWLDRTVALSMRQRPKAVRAAYRLTALTRKARAELWVTRILDRAAAESWPATTTAAAIVAQLAPRRLRDNIFGPCVYCGSWVAGTVDHVEPSSRGGSNEGHNLVSACLSCNSRKGPRTPDEWAA